MAPAPRPFERRELEELHDAISAKGEYVANNTLRHVQMLFNTAGKKLGFDHLDKEVMAAVDFHKQERRREPVQDLAAWWAAVHGIDNAVRRDLWLLILFTGLRRDDAKTVRWEHVDFDAGTIHRPQPKGGKDRAFTVPLPGIVLDLLRRRQAENGADDGWVFRAVVHRDGQLVLSHVVGVKHQDYYRDSEGKRRKRAHPVIKSAHRLRDTFASAAKDAETDWFALKLLMNYRLPSSDVTAGYVRPTDLDELRAAAEKVTARLLERAGQPGYASVAERP